MLIDSTLPDLQQQFIKSLRGSLYYMVPSLTREQISGELDAMQAVGFDIVWINGSVFELEYLQEAGDSTPLEWVFDEADVRGMKVAVEIVSRPDWFVHWDAEEDTRRSNAIVDLLVDRFGHHRSLWAFYFGYELYVTYGAQKEYCLQLWSRLAEHCKQRKPEAKLIISPFFITDRNGVLGPHLYAEPEEYTAFWRTILAAVPFDILMLQDSGEHTSFITIEQRRPYFQAIKQACDEYKVALWGNVELAEIAVQNYEELLQFRGGYGQHADGAGFLDPRWIQVPIPRLIAKMNLAADYCEHLISWGYQQFMSPYCDKPGATAYYASYQEIWRQHIKRSESI